jgi:hypothetical protein
VQRLRGASRGHQQAQKGGGGNKGSQHGKDPSAAVVAESTLSLNSASVMMTNAHGYALDLLHQGRFASSGTGYAVLWNTHKSPIGVCRD